MDEQIEKLLTIIGDNKRYQYFLLIIIFMTWIIIDIIPISLPFLEKTYDIIYENSLTGEIIKTSLNYTICEKHIQYNITKTYNYSWTIEFGLCCDKILTGLIGSITFIGAFLGSLIFPIFADSYGRKYTTIIFAILFCFILFLFHFVHNIYVALIFSLFAECFALIYCLGSFVLISEVTSKKLRSIFTSVINSGFCICGITYSFLYEYIDDWRTVFLISASLTFLMIVIYYFLSLESPRYYLAKGDRQGFIVSLSKIANRNNIDISNQLNDPKSDINNLIIQLEENRLKEKDKKRLPGYSLIKYRSVRFKFLISSFLWFCISGNYYAITINIKNMPGDIYLNGIKIYIVEMFSYFITGISINKIGRKLIMQIYFLFAIIGYIILMLFNLGDTLLITIIFISRFLIAGIFNILFTYSMEIYPTVLRAQGFGFNSVCARLGNIIFPMLNEIINNYINLVFTILNGICLILLFSMPETKNSSLKHDIDENSDTDENNTKYLL